MTCGGRSWAGPERGSEILCMLTHGMGSTPPPPSNLNRCLHNNNVDAKKKKITISKTESTLVVNKIALENQHVDK